MSVRPPSSPHHVLRCCPSDLARPGLQPYRCANEERSGLGRARQCHHERGLACRGTGRVSADCLGRGDARQRAGEGRRGAKQVIAAADEPGKAFQRGGLRRRSLSSSPASSTARARMGRERQRSSVSSSAVATSSQNCSASAPTTAVSAVHRLSSESSAKERWSKLAEPTLAQPSTSRTLACSIVGWYSKTRTPASRSRP